MKARFTDTGIEFENFTPDLIGAATPTQLAQLQAALLAEINSLKSKTEVLEALVANLTPANVGLGSLSQDSTGSVKVNVSQANQKLEIIGTTIQKGVLSVSESECDLYKSNLIIRKDSGGIKLHNDVDIAATSISFNIDSKFSGEYKNFEWGVGKYTYAPDSLIFNIYKGDGSTTTNHRFRGVGDSWICRNNGNTMIGGNTTPSEKLHVVGFGRFTSGLKVGVNNNQILYGSSPPTNGTYTVGDQVFNTAPTAGGFIGWVCTSAGSPGIWKTFGVISA